MTENTPLSDRQLNQLTAPLNKNRVATRRQGGRQLSYVENWDIIRSLIRIFGFGGFSFEVTDAQVLNIERDIPKSGGGTTAFRVTAMCRAKLHIPQLGCTYEEAAVASQAGADPGEVSDFAIKTATSDAQKRCARHLGTQFGLSLYDDGSLEDIVGAVMAPGQEWPPRDESHTERAERQAEVLESGVTPEQRAANQALVDRAMGMKAERDGQQEMAEANAAVAESVNQ